ncbi:hypothetical protein RI845_15035 [Thalassotalea nanhaiensis]|uniref:DUF3955 domain-containing protein n=1 Tax=Thalassotalea nanhaiensis TaxID=3065648 RepID=A0ABY9TGC1_9GAMM|nr:hypothetical protein RI845_15035 [Colwelliaceae bacterium SQ345]
MYLSPSNYKNVLRVVGLIFICIGLVMGYSAIEAMLNPNVSVVLNGVSRNDTEAKLFGLFIPCIITVVGFWLCLSKGQSLTNLHKVRESFWSIFHGK